MTDGMLVPINYWYYSRSNEIFLDLDNKKSLSRAFNVLSKALRRGELDIENVYLYPTATEGHVHLIVVLGHDMPIVSRLAWSLWMANDRLRVAFVMERFQQYMGEFFSWEIPIESFRGDLLVGARHYHRFPDDRCTCVEKHKAKEVTSQCPAMARLIGSDAASADYFTRTGRVGLPPVDSFLVSWGRVSKTRLRKWGNSKTNGRKNLLPNRGPNEQVQHRSP